MVRNKVLSSASVMQDIAIIDLFCGAGGLSYGFKKEGFSVACGIDVDENCRYAYETNNENTFILQDIRSLSPEDLNQYFKEAKVKVLVGCAPCQPFSTYNRNNNNPDWALLETFSTLIADTLPDIVSMENVPQLIRFNEGKVFEKFLSVLRGKDYHIAYKVLSCQDYGLPQKRSRLVLLASRLGSISLPKPTHANNHQTVSDAIGKLPRIEAGQRHEKDALHRSSSLSEKNLKRIKASKPGGTWKDWDIDLVADCHRKETGQTYGSVYGRMSWDKPSPTITTQFNGFGNGRFGHPEQDRALSLREGAILQGFPKSYKFFDHKKPMSSGKVSQMIGNAVPVTLGRVIARSIKKHLEEQSNDE